MTTIPDAIATRAALDAAVAEMYEDAGLPAPVILEPVDAGVIKATIGGVRVYLAADGRVGIGDSYLPPALARQVARMLVSVADAAESGPAPAEIEELAAALRGFTPGMASPGADYRTEVARQYAEAALRWMRGRRAVS